jgi:hypothetical protein
MNWKGLAFDNFIRVECPCWDCLLWCVQEAKDELDIL